jgi:hypothetical protein
MIGKVLSVELPMLPTSVLEEEYLIPVEVRSGRVAEVGTND